MEENNDEEVLDGKEDYIKVIADLKKNTVPKDEYEKIKKERTDLLKALAEGKEIKEEDSESSSSRIKDLRVELYSEDSELNNLDYISKTLELRDELLKETGRDFFAPYGSRITPDDSDLAAAQRVADVFKQCIEFAQGDSELFTNELQRRMQDVVIKKRAAR